MSGGGRERNRKVKLISPALCGVPSAFLAELIFYYGFVRFLPELMEEKPW
jgi:hypothetical protein